MFLDRLLAAFLVLLATPILLLRAFVALREERRVVVREVALGRNREPITLTRFAGTAGGRNLPLLLSVVRGDLRFIGPHPLSERDAARTATTSHRFRLTPGLFSVHRLKVRTGISYERHELEHEDVHRNQSLVDPGNVALILRTLVARVLDGGGVRYRPPTFDMLGVRIENASMQEALDRIFAWAGRPGDPRRRRATVTFVNPDCLNTACEDADYRAILSRAAMVLPDGIGIRMAARWHSVAVRENLNGTDMFPRLCERAAFTGTSIYLLGARPGVAEEAAAEMVRRYPRLRIAGTQHGYFDITEERQIVREINDSGADILLVAFGVPRQEKWLARHADDLTVPVRMGVGGLFDFYSGRIPRAPMWIREMGFEWVWRLCREPRRMWRRYVIGNPRFLIRVWRGTHQYVPPATRADEPVDAPARVG